MTTAYLTESQMTALIDQCRAIRKGYILNPARKPYTVIVDGKHYGFATTTALRKFLESCTVPENYRVFRNADKGATINLDA